MHLCADSSALAAIRGLATWHPALCRALSAPGGLTLRAPSQWVGSPGCPREGEQLAQGLQAEPEFAHVTRLQAWTHVHMCSHTHTHSMIPGTSITRGVKGAETFSPSIPGAPGNPSSPWKGAESERGHGVLQPLKGVCGWAAPPTSILFLVESLQLDLQHGAHQVLRSVPGAATSSPPCPPPSRADGA